MLDLERHILAKGFAVSAPEYKEVAVRLAEVGVIGDADRRVLARLAGYRDRLVHFYDEISERELYEGDIEQVTRVIADWTQRHPERFDHRL